VIPFPRVRVRPHGARRIRSGHPWVFDGDVENVDAPANGDVVAVLDGDGSPLGFAFHSSASKIRLRMVSRADPPGPALWSQRVGEALERREGLAGPDGACRLVFGESDGIPGLVIDRYGEHLVAQALTRAAERVLPSVLDEIAARAPFASVLARNDPAVRALEGLSREVVQLRGATPERIAIREGSVTFTVDPWRGQKTGAFLDQRENRHRAASLARGRVLDAFCYQAWLAIQAAPSADEVVAIDASADALRHAAENVAANGVANVRLLEANVFDDLRARERRGEAFDLIWLDPPAFAKSRRDFPEARRGYKEINLRAMRLLARGGHLVTSSCSYHLDEPAFLDLLGEAAADVRREFVVVERRTQSSDHPIRLGFPESHYLKCIVLRLA
jgi:23S rRNA (cytosine1962-C5)-methyltransferase